jgi:hypothetical protein
LNARQSRWSVALAVVACGLSLSACGSKGSADGVARAATSRATAELCVAAGTWAAATHYKEHVRRPDPLEGHNLEIAQSRADEAVSLFRKVHDAKGLAVARRLQQGDERFRVAYQTGVGYVSAETYVVDVLADLPPSCVLSSRAIGPS